MVTQIIEFVFDAEPVAYRFLNTVKNWHQDGLKAEYGSDSACVKVSYLPANAGFDDTLSRLDRLADDMGGRAL
ncbi:hypothetical protein [Alteromonas facilis]|uniref:hypothetical protein n=1 Tax=Alteromonas facilis TaxID=2048004 RepID=UPI000C2924B0|nr:hypothetical protein [Alteromonas facilis]